jgi:TRAP-type C4-dicarboxylate transport system permease large subunit
MAETLLIVFVVCILLGMPISIALGIGALGAAILFPPLNPIIIPTRFVADRGRGGGCNALAVPPIFYREPAWRDLPQIFADSARLSGVIGMIIGFVGAFGWVLTYSKFPFAVAASIASIAPEVWLFLLLIIALYIVLGTFLTPSEIILVTVPVLLPVASAVGVHPIHFGMVCVVASAIGHITPPVGLCLFVGMAISGLPMEKLARPLLPFLAAIVAVLLVLAFVPEIVLYLPRALGFTR